MDREAWWVTVHETTKNQIRLSNWACMHSIQYRGLKSVYVHNRLGVLANIQFITRSDVKPYGFIVKKKKKQVISHNAFMSSMGCSRFRRETQAGGRRWNEPRAESVHKLKEKCKWIRKVEQNNQKRNFKFPVENKSKREKVETGVPLTIMMK